MDSGALNGVQASGVAEKASERALCRSQHVTVTRVQLRHPRSRLSSRPVSMPAERVFRRRRTDDDDPRSASGQDEQSIEEAEEADSTKARVGTNYRSTCIDTQTLRRTWDKQYKFDAKAARLGSSSPSEGSAVDSGCSSASMPSVLSLGTSIGPIYPNRPYTVAVRPSRTLKREDGASKNNTVTTVFRAPRTLLPPPGTFYKPPTGSKAKSLQDCRLANSAEEEEEEDEDEEEEDELGIEIEVSVDEPLEEDGAVEQADMSPSSSPEELGQNQAKPVYQRLRPRRLQEAEHREAHFV